MSTARATTPTFRHTFTEESLDLTAANHVYVTYRQGAKALTKTGDDIEVEPKAVTVYLTQKETLMFKEGVLECQVNWTSANGRRAASKVKGIELEKNLLDKVVE